MTSVVRAGDPGSGPLDDAKRVLPGIDVIQAGDVVRAHVDNIWPAQAYIGIQEVMSKADKIRAMSSDQRRSYLLKQAVPVVIGPGGKLFILDHHHLARAVVESGHSRIFVRVMANWKDLDLATFWSKMNEAHWTYLVDTVNDAQISPEDLPVNIHVMENDPYRSLAGMLRDAGGYVKKEGDYFVEFVWARALRVYFEQNGRRIREDNWKKDDVQKALEFAKSPAAAHLPGAELSCERIFE